MIKSSFLALRLLNILTSSLAEHDLLNHFKNSYLSSTHHESERILRESHHTLISTTLLPYQLNFALRTPDICTLSVSNTLSSLIPSNTHPDFMTNLYQHQHQTSSLSVSVDLALQPQFLRPQHSEFC